MFNWLSLPLKRILTPPAGEGLVHNSVLAVWDTYAVLHATFGFRNHRTPAGALRLNGQIKSRKITADFFRTHITEDLLPFWQQHANDPHLGGFITNLDRRGNVYDDSFKTAAMQSRMVYGFSCGYALSGDLEYLRLAKHGLRCLVRPF